VVFQGFLGGAELKGKSRDVTKNGELVGTSVDYYSESG
jgi:hypothetical protein